jgi:crossover junction endodeoxyribonuclease RuvC
LRVLGIDPGSHITGYGVVEKGGRDLVEIDHGEIKPPRGMLFSGSLLMIHERLLAVVGETKPDAIAIEDIFYGKNVKSLIKQAHVRGAVILAGSRCQVPVFEYTPLEVKKAVVGYGRAEKNQVQMMVRAILKLPELPPADAADALAVAICHINFLKVQPT